MRRFESSQAIPINYNLTSQDFNIGKEVRPRQSLHIRACAIELETKAPEAPNELDAERALPAEALLWKRYCLNSYCSYM